MRRFVLLFIFSMWAISSSAVADSRESSDHVRIETNQKNGSINFIIDNKPVVQINRDGLHVVESIVYGTTLVDTGSAHVEKLISPESQEPGGRDE